MALIEYLDPDDAEGRAHDLLDADAGYYGRPSLFARAMATNPEVFAARTDYHTRVVQEGSIDSTLSELAYLAVSLANECEYCVASHSEQLVERVGVPAEDVEAIRRGDLSGFDDRERTVIEFADQVARDPKRVTEDDIDSLRGLGFDDAMIVEVITICAAAIAANTFVDVLNIHPADRDEEFAGYSSTNS